MNTTATALSSTTTADQVLDSRDVSCPLPIIQTAQAMNSAASTASSPLAI